GQVQVSPQRRAAIATGHTDRETIFEKPVLKQVLWVLLVIAHRLNFPKLKEWLRVKLIAAGNPNYFTAEEYLALSIFTGCVLGVVVELISFFSAGSIAVGWLAGFVVGTLLSILQLQSRANQRLRLISRRIPYALDLISLAMGAGATFTEALRSVVREEVTDEEDPLNVELRTVLAEMELGNTRRETLQNLADRVPLENLRSIVASVIQAEELGTPLGDVLHEQATLLRLQRSVRAEHLAAVASVRILLPSLLIVMSVILALFAPAIVKVMRQGGLF
ncbi:MAG: type II secretion system F family protein, partial [Phycisphaerae bacterium]